MRKGVHRRRGGVMGGVCEIAEKERRRGNEPLEKLILDTDGAEGAERISLNRTLISHFCDSCRALGCPPLTRPEGRARGSPIPPNFAFFFSGPANLIRAFSISRGVW